MAYAKIATSERLAFHTSSELITLSTKLRRKRNRGLSYIQFKNSDKSAWIEIEHKPYNSLFIMRAASKVCQIGFSGL
jgi:hypothetical protein